MLGPPRTPFRHARPSVRVPGAAYRPQGPVPGRPGPTGDGARWLRPRLTPFPAGRGPRGRPTAAGRPGAAIMRPAGMQLRPRAPGQVCSAFLYTVVVTQLMIIKKLS